MTMVQKRPDRTLGPGHDAFWAWCAKGELQLPRCEHCKELAWPVVQNCENCGNAVFTWERMSGRGSIVSWCTFQQDYYQGVLPLPWDVILVELEEGPLFISNPDGFSLDHLEIGMPVELTFRECEDSAGRFNIPTFRRC